MTPTVVWILVALLLVLGFLGTVIPGLPGAPLILGGAILLEVFLPQYLAWWSIAAIAVLAVLCFISDLAFTALGGRKLGAGRWGMIGASIGALVGLLGGPFGILAGAFLGALVGELAFAGRGLEESARAALGASLGLFASAAAKIVMAAMMIGLFLLDAFLL